MSETHDGNLFFVEDLVHSDVIERVTGSGDLSYSMALSFGRAALTKSHGGDVAFLGNLTHIDEATILAKHGWLSVYFRAESITTNETMAERFAVTHSMDTAAASKKLGNFTGYSTDLKIGKPLARIKVSDAKSRLPSSAQEAVDNQLRAHGWSPECPEFTPLPVLMAHVRPGADPASVILCQEGTDLDDYLRDDPETRDANKLVPNSILSQEEKTALRGLLRIFSDEGRAVLKYPEG